MRIKSFRIAGIRCFEDTGDIALSPTCNIFVGQNNAGKSTLLKGMLAFQGFPFANDLRLGTGRSFHEIVVTGVTPTDYWRIRPAEVAGTMRAIRIFRDPLPPRSDQLPTAIMSDDGAMFMTTRPGHLMVPFLAKRKAAQLDHNITSNAQVQISGTFANLYSRIDLVATAGHPRHELFHRAVKDIVGLPITTKATANGKEAGFYLDEKNFISFDRMGDGVTEMVALIVELCLERNKVFVLEEPETNLHPSALKALLGLVRSSLEQNQFMVSTHSNIVVRELGFDERTRMFRVWRDVEDQMSPSLVEEIPRTALAHTAILRELGYEFTDLGLHEGWLFLEESSAETVINEVLIPTFASKLKGRLRTFSAGGATNIEPSTAEFQRLITFVHLESVYRGRLWIRVDNDDSGRAATAALQRKFSYLNDETCTCFSQPSFELFYPSHFKDRVIGVLQIQQRPIRRAEKEKLLLDVLQWTKENGEVALKSWEESAAEPIEMLRSIEKVIG